MNSWKSMNQLPNQTPQPQNQQLPPPSKEREKEIVDNVKRILYEVDEARAKYGRSDDIRVMAVTKTVSPAEINIAINQGINLLGENRVQEYLGKREFYLSPNELHIIGHLQTNKVKYIAEFADMIESVDSIRVAEEIDKCCKRIGRIMPVLCEINIGDENSKDGIDIHDVYDILVEISKFSNIKVKGLMSIPPKLDSENFFYKMQELFVDIRDKNIDNINMDVLSMGMSNDFGLGIKYGSNIVRIGTGLFGVRK